MGYKLQRERERDEVGDGSGAAWVGKTEMREKTTGARRSGIGMKRKEISDGRWERGRK